MRTSGFGLFVAIFVTVILVVYYLSVAQANIIIPNNGVLYISSNSVVNDTVIFRLPANGCWQTLFNGTPLPFSGNTFNTSKIEVLKGNIMCTTTVVRINNMIQVSGINAGNYVLSIVNYNTSQIVASKNVIVEST